MTTVHSILHAHLPDGAHEKHIEVKAIGPCACKAGSDQLEGLRVSKVKSRVVGEFSKAIAKQFANSHEDEDVRRLYVEWAIDHYVALELEHYVPVADKIIEALMRNGSKEYNDLDNDAFMVPWKEEYLAFAIEDQTTNYLYVRRPGELQETTKEELYKSGLELMPVFIVYRYWKPPLSKRWGDNQVSLRMLKKNKGTTYNDNRDAGWIMQLPFARGYAENGMIDNFSDYEHALFNLRMLVREFEEEP